MFYNLSEPRNPLRAPVKSSYLFDDIAFTAIPQSFFGSLHFYPAINTYV